MIAKLFLLFTLVPLTELYILLEIGAYLGAANTILLIIFTGILGAYLARLEGIRTIHQISQTLATGTVPAEELMDAVLIFVAGVVLVTPGVITDVAGFLLLIPQTRNIFKRWLRRKFDRMVAEGNFQVRYRGWGDGDRF
ncbi:MAG: FxsA family protein [Deltaproteobacteria bacterium]|nr:FxsA family protein [Deltaproteobacteria bacterium]